MPHTVEMSIAAQVKGIRKWRYKGFLIACFVFIACFLWLLFLHTRAMRRVAHYNAYLILRESYQHYENYGVLTNPFPNTASVFPFTNRLSIQGSNYDCVIAMKWKDLSDHGFTMAATRQGVAIWFDKRTPPRLLAGVEMGSNK